MSKPLQFLVRVWILVAVIASIGLYVYREKHGYHKKSYVNSIAVQDTLHRYARIQDSIYNEIYTFMQVVMTQEKIDLSYGLDLEPYRYFDSLADASSFLNQMVRQKPVDTVMSSHIKREKRQVAQVPDSSKKTDSTSLVLQVDTTLWRLDPRVIAIDHTPYPKCLTQADVTYMVKQHERLQNFQWENDRLGFTLENRSHWYAFSVPVFSKDRKTAVLAIENLCPGLCGTRKILVFQKKGDQWMRQQVSVCWH